MRPLNTVILIIVGAIVLAGGARECEAQDKEWFEHRDGRGWFIGRLDGNEFPVVHPDDRHSPPDDPNVRRALGLMIHIEKRGLAYFATVHAYFEHGPDDNDDDRYRDRRRLHQLRYVRANIKAGRGEVVFEAHGLPPGDVIIQEMTLHGIPNRHSDTNTILCGFKFKGESRVARFGCDEPPMEDILEEEEYYDEMPEDEEPEYIEEEPEYYEDEMPENGA